MLQRARATPFIAFLAISAACSGTKAKEKGQLTADPPSEKLVIGETSCPEQVAEMEEWLVPLRADQDFGSYLGNDVDLVFAEGEFQPLHAPVLALYPGGYEFMGETTEWKQDEDGRKLAAILVRTQEDGKLAFPNVRPKTITWEQFGLHFLLAVEGDVPWREVVGAVGSLKQTGYRSVSFIFARHATASPPPDSSITKSFEELRERQSVAFLAKKSAELIQPVMELCPPLAEKMRELSGMEPSAKTAFIIDSGPDALLACDCGGLPEMRSAIWHIFSRSIFQWGLTIDIHAEPAVHTISVDGDTRWADATKDLLSLAAEEPPPVSLQVR